MLCSTIAWDWPDRKCEDDPSNTVYFFSDDYKKEFCKPLEKIRKESKITYYENKITDTQFNFIETKDENIIAFRGSDSKQDWAADFNFFKIKFKENNDFINNVFSNEISEEAYDKYIFNQYAKSEEGFLEGVSSFFKESKLVNFNKIANTEFNFDNFKNHLFLHKGFLTQISSIIKEYNEVINKCKNNNKEIIICGHSLGAGLGILAYLFLLTKENNLKNRTSCYVYGTPKPCSIEVYDYIRKISNNKLNIVNIESDLVSDLPPEGLGYKKPKNDYTITNIKAPYNTKFNHTVFYYLYCFANKVPILFNKK